MDKGIDPLVGRTVAQYEVVAKLGGGGMGVVYAARDTKLGRRVALKFLPPRWSHDESAKQRFVREAQAASATDHRNICTIHDIETADDGQLFIVMAHYDGETLKQRLERGPIPVEEAIEIAAQVAEGLAKAHAQGVVHRDIKPGNLMITEDGVKILDFGLAKLAAEALKLTLEGSTLGTVAYMSPEQARGDDADARSDVWALGVVLYEMLAGEPPFRGPYAEAITHAIRNEEPAPIGRPGREIPEHLERLIARTLTKNPDERVQSARELARELRMLQGRTIPLDLRTEPLPSLTDLDAGRTLMVRRRWWTSRRAIGLAAALVLVTVGAPLWILSPVERIPVAVAPVINQTGYAELDSYRLALTEDLTGRLADLPGVRVMPYDRLLQIVQRFRAAGQDVSSREALQAITKQSDVRVLIVPTLVYENGGWKTRVEFRDPATAANQATFETPSVASSLMKDTVYTLTASLGPAIDGQFLASGSRRAYAAASIRRLLGRDAGIGSAPRLRSLDAAAAFERGLAAYEQLEYADARQAFGSAAELDPRNPLPLAWRSRVASLMRQDKDAADSADQASRLITDQLSVADRLFVEGVVAESRRNAETAEARYRSLVERYPDESAWVIELAGFHDRQGKADDAVAGYHRALALDGRLVRPHLELCRLYSPNRLNEPALAKEQGELALSAYTNLANQGGEAQALFCLSDVLRTGNETDRRESRRDAEDSLQIMQKLGYPYGTARAHNYVGNVALLAERNGREAAVSFERALAGARQTGNVFMESRVLMNLGASYELFGLRSTAVKYYRSSFDLFETIGSQQEAAWNQANAAAILIEYGGNPEQGFRDMQNALVVFQKMGDRYFEVFARRVIGWYYRYTGHSADALRELTLAQGVANEHNLTDRGTQISIDLARLKFDGGDYVAALELFAQASATASGTDNVHTIVERARTNVRLGEFEIAEMQLAAAAIEIKQVNDLGSLPLLYFAQGELAYESGHLAEARARFAQSAEYWRDDLPEATSVEARAYEGLLLAIGGQPARGRMEVLTSLEQARQMRRAALEARCQVFLARIELAGGRPKDAIQVLANVPPETDVALGPELRAQVHYWRSQALTRVGDRPGATAQAEIALKLLADLRARFPEALRKRFMSRPDVLAAAEG